MTALEKAHFEGVEQCHRTLRRLRTDVADFQKKLDNLDTRRSKHHGLPGKLSKLQSDADLALLEDDFCFTRGGVMKVKSFHLEFQHLKRVYGDL
jgi:hypothetical protein